MKVQGTFVYDPVALAKGKNRARIIRRHAHELHTLVRAFRPYFHNKDRKTANVLDQLLADDPNYWIRRKGQVSTPRHLDQLLDHAIACEALAEHPNFRIQIEALINKINQDLVTTRRERGWAILTIDNKVLRPWLEAVRANGTTIGMSVWGAHISVIRGEADAIRNWELWGKHSGRNLTVEIDSNSMRKNKAGYYWLSVKSTELESIRTELKLPPRPRPPFHLTIGKAS